MRVKPKLTIEQLLQEAATFSELQSTQSEPALFGINDGKKVGTYLEHRFRNHLVQTYEFVEGNSASGIDFPALLVDIKTTSIVQPQSSCPFSHARQKIYGLGYSLLIFVYRKLDDADSRTSILQVVHCVYVQSERTADYQMTRGLLDLLKNDANEDDIAAFILDRNLPVDEIGAADLAREVMLHPPSLGVLTISNALQWRLQYQRAISVAGRSDGVVALYPVIL